MNESITVRYETDMNSNGTRHVEYVTGDSYSLNDTWLTVFKDDVVISTIPMWRVIEVCR